jgi:hypothetical protein
MMASGVVLGIRVGRKLDPEAKFRWSSFSLEGGCSHETILRTTGGDVRALFFYLWKCRNGTQWKANATICVFDIVCFCGFWFGFFGMGCPVAYVKKPTATPENDAKRIFRESTIPV